MKKIVKYLLFSASAFALFNSAALAQCLQTTTWIDGTGSWFTATNWNNGVPGSTKAAQLNNGGTAQIIGSLPGVVATACSLTLGTTQSGSGTVSVNGATGIASLNVSDGIVAGSQGTGKLNVTNGAAATSATVTVGSFGTGSVTVSNGGRITTSGSAFIGSTDRRLGTGNGTVTIDGASSILTVNGQLNVGGDRASGIAALSLKSNGSVIANSNSLSNPVHIWPNGTLAGDGSVASSGTQIDGTLAPAGALSFSGSPGNVIFTSTATASMDVTPTTVDTVNIQGAAALDGHLIVTVGNVATGRYTLLTATGGLNNTQFSIVSIIIQPPLGASISYDAQHVYLNVATCCD